MKKKSYQIIKIAKAYSFFRDFWWEKRDCIGDTFLIDFNITFTNEELDGGRWTSLIWRCGMSSYFCCYCFIKYFKVGRYLSYKKSSYWYGFHRYCVTVSLFASLFTWCLWRVKTNREYVLSSFSLFQLLLTTQFPFKLSEKVLQTLTNIFLYHDFSIQNFIKGLQVRRHE